MRSRVKSKKSKKVIKKKTLVYFLVVSLLIAIPLTIYAARQIQITRQEAQTNGPPPPPMYGCMSLGGGDKKNCPSLWIKAGSKLTLHDRTARNKITYYGDTIKATVEYTNTGDVVWEIASMGVAGKPKGSDYRIDFEPKHPPATVQPGQTITLENTAHTFNAPDRGGEWAIFTTATDKYGQVLDGDTKTRIWVDSTCTALRRQPLTDAVKKTVTDICATGKQQVLCQQLCEITGEQCL